MASQSELQSNPEHNKNNKSSVSEVGHAKNVANFAKTNPNFIIKSGFAGGEVVDATKVEALSKMPSRNELIGMLLSTWMAPITNFTIGLDALRAKKQESE